MSRGAARAEATLACTDGELFARVARGDLGPLGELFDRHHASVRSFVRRAAGANDDVDDLVQETFVTAARAAASFDPAAPARPFLLGIAAQLLRRRRRTFARLRAFVDKLTTAPRPSPRTPEDETADGEEADRLHAAIATLSLDHRLVIGMVELSGLSGVDAARALDVPVGTVWRRLHDARIELRRKLERRERGRR